MRHKNCIFVSEDDCPKNEIKITCEECFKNKYYEIIENATRDFVGLGESFTEIFQLHKQLIDADGGTVSIKTPVESIMLVNRVMATFLSATKAATEKEHVYQKLIVYFFGIVVDDYETIEDTKKDSVH